jgi:hypothetical protein
MSLHVDLSFIDCSSPLSPNPTVWIGPTLNYNGFPATNPGTLVQNNLIIACNTITDSYSPVQNQGFYLQSQNNIAMDLTNIQPSAFPYTGTVSQTQNGQITGISNYVFRYDGTNGNPTSNSLSFTFSNVSFVQISGIYIIYGTPVLQMNIGVYNMGIFYYSSPYVVYTCTIGSVISSLSLNTLTDATINTISTNTYGGNTYSYLSNPVSITNTLNCSNINGIYATSIVAAAKMYNIDGSGNSNTATISCIVDGPSYTLIGLFKSSVSSASASTNAITGYRIYSDVGVYTDSYGNTSIPDTSLNGVSYSTIAYDNTWSILPGATGQYELQIANGYIQTAASANQNQTGYINYRNYYYTNILKNTYDYSSLMNSTGYRYITFVWSILPPSSGSYSTLIFTMTGCSPVPSINLPGKSGLAYADTNNKILLYYRIENTQNMTGSINSFWIDGNSQRYVPVNSSNYDYLPSQNSPNTILYGLKNVSVGGTSCIFSTINPIPFSSGNVSNQVVYCRIGLPMQSNFKFKTITLGLSSL